METNKILSKLEALLFVYGEPMDVKKIGKIMGLNDSEVESGLEFLRTELARSERGLSLMKKDDRYQLVSKPELADLLEGLIKQEFDEDLTQAALETLSIIAYAAPVTRADLEYIRGVNSSFILRSLMMRGLVERSVHSKKGNAYVYNVSFDLLKRLGIPSVENLPDYQKYNDLAKLLYQETLAVENVAVPAQNPVVTTAENNLVEPMAEQILEKQNEQL